MIDTFAGLSPDVNLAELLLETLQEFGIFFLHLLAMAALYAAAKRIRNRSLSFFVAFIMPASQLIYLLSGSTRQESFYQVFFSLTLTLVLFELRLLELPPAGYLYLFSVMLFPVRLFSSAASVLGDLWLFLTVFAAVYTAVLLSFHTLSGNQFGSYFSFTMLSLSAYLYQLVVRLVLNDPGRVGPLPLVGSSLLMTSALLVLGYLTEHLLHRRLQGLVRLGRRYPDVEPYFFRFTVGILALCLLIFLPFTLLLSQTTLLLYLTPALCLAVLFSELSFVLLLYRVAYLRDSAALSKKEAESLSAYYRDLTGSLEQMRKMRHDVKNLFFTMGHFVDRSDDTEMKEFFWEKIYPYAQNSIRQSEVLSKVHEIPDEALRSFFYLKLSQGLQQGIAVRLGVDTGGGHLQTGMNVLDLVRVLGILLDNAIEETMLLPEKQRQLRTVLRSRTGRVSIVIENPVTEKTARTGIHPGTSSKGEGHGNGLIIVRDILDGYEGAVLNSILQDGRFTQSLNLSVPGASADLPEKESR